MDFNEKDMELIELLAKVRAADSEYPEELLTSRRQHFMKELGEMGAFVGLGLGLKKSSSSTPPVASKVVETMLVIAIVAEAGAVAFLNRDRLTEIVRKVSQEPRVEQASTSTSVVAMPVELDVTNTAYWTSTPAPSVTVSVTPSLASSPTENLIAGGTSTEGSAANTPQVGVTPGPKDNNGNHYGQTPKPERTKENGNNNPKDPKKTREPKDPKPTKKPKGK